MKWVREIDSVTIDTLSRDGTSLFLIAKQTASYKELSFRQAILGL
jgi:hypothetical protein